MTKKKNPPEFTRPKCADDSASYEEWVKYAKKAPPEFGFCGDADPAWCRQKHKAGLCERKVIWADCFKGVSDNGKAI